MNDSKLSRALHTARKMFGHFVRARFWRGHGVHSPYVYHIVRHVISAKIGNATCAKLADTYRHSTLSDKTVVDSSKNIGARKDDIGQTTVEAIAHRTAISRKVGHMLGRLVADAKANGVIELGTSTGISTAYLAAYCPEATVVSIEAGKIGYVAEKRLKELGIDNVSVVHAMIDDELDKAIESLPNGMVDFAFVDANHTYEATIRYKDKIVEHCAERCTIVFDDIYWSKGMTRAWQEIVSDSRIMTTIELCGMGIAVVRTGCQKEHYMVRW